jgi:site-specific recombinase XerD
MNTINSFQDYLLLEKMYSLHTVTAYLNDIGFFQSFLSSQYDDNNVINANYNQIRSWIVSLSDDGISNASINRKIASLKSFYKFLLKTKQIETSPLLKNKALKAPKKLQIPFSEKELDEVLNFIKSLQESGTLTDYNQIAFLFKSVKNERVIELANFLEENGIQKIFYLLKNVIFLLMIIFNINIALRYKRQFI